MPIVLAYFVFVKFSYSVGIRCKFVYNIANATIFMLWEDIHR